MLKLSMLLALSLSLIADGFDHDVTATCPDDVTTCEFDFRLSYNWTMMRFLESGRMNPVRIHDDGSLWYTWKNCTGETELTKSEAATLLVGDGTHKMVLAINGQVPGPPIVVYENQEVVVTFTNDLVNEVVTLHFHGMLQKGSPWMDGVMGVTQCPIAPGQSFKYRFKAHPTGTHWYHAHSGPQRSMGFAGPMIVLPANTSVKNKEKEFSGDFIVMVQDWMHDHSREIYHRLKFDLLRFPVDYSPEQCYAMSTQSDGLQVGVTPFVSGLINGKGRFYNKTTDEPVNKRTPLENFNVQKGGKYRFRLISASMTFSFRVSIDNHDLHVISTEAEALEDVLVESLMIHPGERYDFWIEAIDPLQVGMYWIRAENLEDSLNSQKIRPGHMEALLMYEGSKRELPSTSRRLCTEESKCLVLNCPFKFYQHNTICRPITELRSANTEKPMEIDPEKFTEYFLNFHFSGNNVFGAFKPNINGRVHVPSSMPHLLYPENNPAKKCEKDCDNDACYCTHIQEVPLDHVVQLVIFIHLPVLKLNGITGTSHPVHMHGHQSELVKIGFPEYDAETGFFENNNEDIRCLRENCNVATWRNASWKSWDLAGSVAEHPIRKDTFIVPAGGYVVVRFKTDNPGFWYLHCHVEYHNEIGMAMVIQEGSTSDIPHAPESMKTCGDFNWTREEFLLAVNDPQPPGTPFREDVVSTCERKEMALRIACVVLTTASGVLIISAIHKLHSRTTNRRL